MKISYDSGICLEKDDKKVVLDPSRQNKKGVVTHGHLDHLTKDAFMTKPTLDILGVRKGERRGKGVTYGFPQNIGGFDVTLYPAGHVFGSSMVMVEDVLYTGDFNPHGGRTCKRAAPYDCETLIIETTYGKKEYRLPPKDQVIEDMRAWATGMNEDEPVVFGAYTFGKAQETVSLLNDMGKIPYVSKGIAELNEIYNKYDLGLEYREIEEDTEPEDKFTAVVPPKSIKEPVDKIVKKAKDKGGSAAYLSGWCAFYPYFRSMDIEAQFPLSDHAGFDELFEFVDQCDPSQVYTVHGSDQEFADIVEDELDIPAEPLK